MIAPNDLKGRVDEIKNYIARANFDEAVKRLLDFTREFAPETETEALLLSSRYAQLKEEQQKNIITYENAKLERNKISEGVLSVLSNAMEVLGQNLVGKSSVIGNAEQLEALLAEEIRKRKVPDDLILKAVNLTKRYRSTDFKFEMEHLEIRLGTITGLVGENAAGKTTLLRILVGDLKHDTGELSYPAFQKNGNLHWPTLKQQIAYVPQELPKWHDSLEDNLRYAAATHGIKGKAAKKAVAYIVERLGLATHISKTWKQLSGGYKLRFSLAKALVWQPRLLIVDEPLANLDIKTQLIVLNDLQNISKSLNNPLGIVISSQHLHEIEAVADQFLFMRNGHLENLGHGNDYGQDRKQNAYEIGCALSYTEFCELIKDFPHHKLWYNGMHYIISCSTDTTGNQLLDFFNTKNISVNYFRDISLSMKTKFYEAHL